MLTAAASADVIPTNKAGFYGGNAYINGNPAPIGTVIDAYDPDGVHCGTWTINKPDGLYGYMPVYGDDDYSDVDDGADEGDLITFRINGVDATPTVINGDIHWKQDQTNLVDLEISGISAALSIVDHPDDKEGAPGQTLRFWIGVQNDGNAGDQISVTATSTLGWTVRSNTEMPHAGIGEIVYTWFEVEIPDWPGDDRFDTLNFTVSSVTDPGVTVEGSVAATASAGTDYGVSITTPPANVTIAPGNSHRFEVGVTNVGNIGDSYTIDVTTNAYWSGSVDATSGIVPAAVGEEVVLWFDITVPAYIQSQDSTGVFNFTVRSASDPATTATGAVLVTPDVIPTDVDDGDFTPLPEQMNLAQNYPNPFNPTTTIAFSLSSRSQVNVSIFDILGRTVESIDMGVLGAGEHEVTWDAASMPSGVYFYRLTTEQGSQTRKMTLLK